MTEDQFPYDADGVSSDERERAKLAANILTAGLSVTYFRIEPIDWEHDGLAANVIISGIHIGDLLTVYNRFRNDDNFHAWLRSKLSEGNITLYLEQDVKNLAKEAPLVSEQLAKLLEELDSPIVWLKISNMRLRVQGLRLHFERIDGLLELLEKRID
jgi:hypothetical protein